MSEKRLLDPSIAIQLMKDQIAKPIESLPYYTAEVKKWWNFSGRTVAETFGDDHHNTIEFLTRFSLSETAEIQQKIHVDNIAEKKALLESFIEQLEKMPSLGTGVLSLDREGIYFSGQTFDALLRVSKLLSNAKASIILIDNYFGKSVLELLSGKAPGVQVQVLTKGPVDPSLAPLFLAFNQQYPKIEVRTANDFHDRFLIVDSSDYFHFGASVKDLGKKGFMFSRIEEPEIVAALNSKAMQVWKSATVVI